MKKNSLFRAKEILKEIDHYLIKEIRINNKKGIQVRCDKKHTYDVSLSNFIHRNSRCPVCKGLATSDRQRKNIKEVLDIINKTPYIPRFKTYKKNTQKLKLECPEHGIFYNTLWALENNRGCSKCSKNYSMTTEEVTDWLSNNTNYKFIDDIYINSTTTHMFECHKHGVFKTKFTYLKNGHGCKKCGYEKTAIKNKNTLEQVEKLVKTSGYELVSRKYHNNRSLIKVKCPEHGVFKTTLHGLKNNSCPKCYTSKENIEIFEYVISLGVKAVLNDRGAIYPNELDIFSKEHNFGIEFNGLYWHSDLFKNSKYHMAKYNKCRDNNINLLGIYSDEWENKKELIMAMIRHRLNILPTNVIRASKLNIVKLNKNNQFNDFFNKFHIDGHVNSSFAYGLFYNEKMISCASFRKNSRDKCWEIARFASDYNYHIHGSLGKILKLFKKEYGSKLISFSNNRLSHGNIYKKLGFEEITPKYSKPSYWYTDLKNRVFRTKCQKINTLEVLKKFKTEKDQALAGLFSMKNFNHNKPLYRIYDYGHRKWEINF